MSCPIVAGASAMVSSPVQKGIPFDTYMAAPLRSGCTRHHREDTRSIMVVDLANYCFIGLLVPEPDNMINLCWGLCLIDWA